MSDNFLGLIKSLLAGIIYSAVLGVVFYFIFREAYVFEELLVFIIPICLGGGFMMGLSVWGAEIGIGRIGLILYVASFVAPIVYGIVCTFVKNNYEYLFIPGCLSVAFVLFYIQLGLGEYNFVLLIIGGVSIFALLLVFSLIAKAGELVAPIVSGVLAGISLITVAIFRFTKGSVLDV